MSRRNRLEPDGLPYARRRCVPDPARLVMPRLFPPRLVLVELVLDSDDDQMLFGIVSESVGDVGVKRGVTADMVSDSLAIDPDRRFIVDRAEMKE